MAAQALSAADRVRALLRDTDERRIDALLAHFTDDMELCFGNDRPVGRDVFRTMNENAASWLASIDHELLGLWEVEGGDAVVAEMVVHYERLDGSRISLPSCSLFRLRGGLVCSYRIFMDTSPLTNSAATPREEMPDA